MEEFSLEKSKRIRVWNNSLPWQEEAGACRVEPRSAAVELLIPMGGYFMYGLLGATLEDAGVADTPARFDIRVPSASMPYPDALAAGIDYVETGLPDEYVPAVLGGARWGAGACVPTGARMRFCCAAHGAVGSSPVGFARLAAIVARILSEAYPVLDAARCENIVTWSRGSPVFTPS